VWIETRNALILAKVEANSPVSNDGCGLKQFGERCSMARLVIHPSAMTGVD